MISKNINRYHRVILICSFLFINIFNIIFSLGGTNGLLSNLSYCSGRYFYVPSIILMFLIFFNIKNPFLQKKTLSKISSIFCLLILLTSLSISIFNYKNINSKFWNNEYPKWKQEVKKHSENKNYINLKIWPNNWYTVIK